MRLEDVGCDVKPFEGAQYRDRRRDDAVAVDQRRSEQPHDDEDAPAFGPVRAGHRHQCQDAAFAVIVGAHDEQTIFDGNGDDQRPEDQRETAERRLRGKMSAGRSDNRLQRVERARSEIAIDDAERSKRGGGRGSASDACQRGIVFLDDIGRQDLGLLSAVRPGARRLLMTRRFSLFRIPLGCGRAGGGWGTLEYPFKSYGDHGADYRARDVDPGCA